VGVVVASEVGVVAASEVGVVVGLEVVVVVAVSEEGVVVGGAGDSEVDAEVIYKTECIYHRSNASQSQTDYTGPKYVRVLTFVQGAIGCSSWL
jgi:hypothetical protein